MRDYLDKSPEREAAGRRARRQRIKLAILILVFGPLALGGIFYMVYGAYKISQGDPVGYEQRDRRTGEIK